MKGTINFFTEGIDFKIVDKRKLKRWIKNEIILEKSTPGSINFIFTSDSILQEYNYKYLKHKSLTDILTFPLTNISISVSGDIFISIDRVNANAKIFRIENLVELYRVMIHGILHLVGYNDKTVEDKRTMREREDQALNRLKNL
jgi:rRNA maturation RNase YbeY